MRLKLLTMFCLMSTGIMTLHAGEFPGGPNSSNCPDAVATGAIFKLTFANGMSPIVVQVSDPATVIGRSDPHTEGDPEDMSAEICGAGAVPYQDMLQFVGDPCRHPDGWVETPATRREVHTQILAFELEGAGGTVSIRAGQPFFDNVQGTTRERFFRHSLGEVASHYSGDPPDFNSDFDADAYFNVYVEVEVNGMFLYNKSPMVLKSTLTQFPPFFKLPQSTYIHDPSFGPVALFDENGLFFAWLSSAGHGSPDDEDFPDFPPEIPFGCPASFAVDALSEGIDPALTGQSNDVFFSFGAPEHPLRSFETQAYGMGNSLWLDVQMGQLQQPFQAGDAMNSLSFGQDGTVVPNPDCNECVNYDGALYFSVTRNSTGATCSDVYRNAWFPGLSAGEAAGDIYASRVPHFGKYKGVPGIFPPWNDNVMAADNVNLGLSPLHPGIGVAEDDMTALELSTLPTTTPCVTTNLTTLAFATFTGPSFSGDEATIYYFNVGAGLYEYPDLQFFASAADMGLQAGDVIDALVLSNIGGEPIDVDNNSSCAEHPNIVLDPGEDEVLFSLAPGSPSLGLGSPANIYYSDFQGSFALYASAADLGLLDQDDVNAADIKPLAPPELACDQFGSRDCLCNDECLFAGIYGRIDLFPSGGNWPYKFELQPGSGPLPSGMRIDQNTGSLVGEPVPAGFYSNIIGGTDADGRRFDDVVVQYKVEQRLAVSYDGPHRFVAGQDVSLNPVTEGSPDNFTASNLPPGLTINNATGEILGTIGGEGGYEAIVQAKKGFEVDDVAVLFLVDAPPLTISYNSPLAMELGDISSAEPTVNGGTEPYTFVLQSGVLPQDVFLDPSSGAIEGIPAEVGSFTALVRVVDFDGDNADVSVTIEVSNPSPPQLFYDSPVVAVINHVAEFFPTVTGGFAPFDYQVLSGSLPPGMSLDPVSGTVDGIPNTLGNYTATIRLFDRYAITADDDLNIIVASQHPKPGVDHEDLAAPSSVPNPVVGQAELSYELEEAAQVELLLYDNLGRRIRSLLNKRQEAGSYRLAVDTAELSPGAYYIRVRIGASEHLINLIVVDR